MTEARTFFEGALRYIQASGTGTLGGTAYSTASAAPSSLIGFVRAGVSINSARDVVTVMERGKPSHHKGGNETPPEIQFTFFDAVTANKPPMNITGAGASFPAVHLELKMDEPERGSDSARYLYFTQAALVSDNWTEAEDGNPNQMTFRALTMHGPTATGFLG